MVRPVYREKIGETKLGTIFVEGNSKPNGEIDSNEKVVLETGDIIDYHGDEAILDPRTVRDVYKGPELKAALKELGLEGVGRWKIRAVRKYITSFKHLQNADNIAEALDAFARANDDNCGGPLLRDECNNFIERQFKRSAEMVNKGLIWDAAATLESLKIFCKRTNIEFNERKAHELLMPGYSKCREGAIAKARTYAEKGIEQVPVWTGTATACANNEGVEIGEEIAGITKKAFSKEYSKAIDEADKLSNEGNIEDVKRRLDNANYYADKAEVPFEKEKAKAILSRAYKVCVLKLLRQADILLRNKEYYQWGVAFYRRARHVAIEGELNFREVVSEYERNYGTRK